MDRRQFLQRSAGMLGIAVIPMACGQSTSEHAGHNMQGMSGMHNMSDMGEMQSSNLADVSVLEKGLPLPALTILANQSTEPNHFKATLTAAPMQVELIKGKPTTFWAYNQSKSPLLIELTEGMSVEIELINHLTQETTIHWHGLPVPPEEDGGPMEAVAPHGKRTYRFTLPDGCAGTYWFHPHPHGNTHEQVFRGLAGAIVVRPKGADVLADLPETHLFITDLKLNADGAIAENDANDEMNGREGQFLLVNGQYQPQLNLSQASRVRVWNATNARFLNLQLRTSTGQMLDIKQVGSDGGLLGQAQITSSLLVSPAERVELILDAASTQQLSLIAGAYNQGKMGNLRATPESKLLDIDLSAAPYTVPVILRNIVALAAPKRQQLVQLSENMSMANGVHSMTFLINKRQFDMKRIDFNSVQGDVEEWVVENLSDMDHPVHIHGGQFQLVRREWIDRQRGAATSYLPHWKDTVNLKSGERVALRMIQQFKGIRMVHCHILEHENAGMMANIKVT